MPYFVTIETTGAPVELWLNGCAVSLFEQGEEGGPGRGSATLEGYVLPGINTIRVVVDPGPTPSRMLEPHPPVAAQARGEVKVFCPRSWDFDPDREPVVARLVWEDQAAIAAPRVGVVEFTAPENRDVPLWWQAVPRAPDGDLLNLMARVQAALDSGDIAALVAFQRLSMEASRLASDQTIEERQQNLAGFLAEVLPEKPVTPHLARAEWDFRSFADGRLIDLIGRDWRPIVRRGNADRMTAIELRVGVIGGLWQVLL